MGPPHGRQMGEQRIRRCGLPGLQMPDRALLISCVPQRDGGDHQVQPRRPLLLVLQSAVGDPAVVADEDRLGQGVASLAIVEPGLAALTQLDPPSFQWTPMLAFRSWGGVSELGGFKISSPSSEFPEPLLDPDALDRVLGDLIAATVVKLGRAR